jgi:hypothetical protein
MDFDRRSQILTASGQSASMAHPQFAEAPRFNRSPRRSSTAWRVFAGPTVGDGWSAAPTGSMRADAPLAQWGD